MPTLLQINSCANWGSTGKIAEQINQAATHKGWKTYLAYGREVNPSLSELIPVGNKMSQAIALAEARLFDNDGLSNRRATQRLVKTIMAIKPDIIHLHNLHGYYINYRILFEYLNTTNIPVVWTLHDCWTFTGHCAHFVEVDCGKWINGCEKCPLKKKYPTSWGFDRSSRNFQLKKQSFASNKNLHLIAVSQWLAGFVKHSFFHNVDLRVINNGIDLNVFKPTKFEKKKKFRILGVSSVWTKSKGLFDVFRLRELLNEDEYEIMLVGLSDEQRKSLPIGITGIARTNSVEELVDYYSSADVFVNPTYADTFPTTNLEALACGTPVITYRTGGSPESVGVGTGMVVKQGDVNAIVDAVKTVQSLGKPHFANACRNRAEQLYNREERYNEYVELYEKLIAER